MRRFVLALCATSALSSAALAQSAVTQGGAILQQHLPVWRQDRQIGDIGGLTGQTSGPFIGRGAAPFSITDNLGIGLQFNTAVTTGAYNSFGIGHNASGNPVFTINGAEYPFSAGAGNVAGPATTTINELAVWNATNGTLLKNGLNVAVAHAGPFSANANPTAASILIGNNTGTTLSTFVSQGVATALNKREVQANIGLDTSLSEYCTGDPNLGNCDKIALFVGVEARAHTLAAYGINIQANIRPGWWVPPETPGGLRGIELDVANFDVHLGETTGVAGMAFPFSYGMDVVGLDKRNTAAIRIATLSAGPTWNRGFVCDALSVKQACIADYSQSDLIIDMGTQTHLAGIEGSNATFSTYFIKGPGTPTAGVPGSFWNGAGVAQFKGLVSKRGTNPDSTGQPAGTFAAIVYNATNVTGESGLLVKSNWGTNAGTAFEVGNDAFGGAYSSWFKVTGDGNVGIAQATPATKLYVNGTFAVTQATPAVAAACTAGQIVADTGFIYTCSASGAWKRVAVAAY